VTVRYDKDGPVATITLDRPHVLNAMNVAMHERLAEVWTDFEADDDLRVGVLRGAGERAFSVGQDLKERAALDHEGPAVSTFGSRGKPGAPRLTDRFDLSKPLVGVAHGYALGGGFELLLACDIVVAAYDAVFGLPEVQLGLVPGAGGVFRLARQMPLRTAMGYLLTGRRMTATEALAHGLVNEVAPLSDLDKRVTTWVDDLVRAAPLAVRAIRQAALASVEMPLSQAFETRFSWEERRMHSNDALEGPRAFAENRPPHWRGN
jgi:enoyl-CoA hydratase/carnithine racemase